VSGRSGTSVVSTSTTSPSSDVNLSASPTARSPPARLRCLHRNSAPNGARAPSGTARIRPGGASSVASKSGRGGRGSTESLTAPRRINHDSAAALPFAIAAGCVAQWASLRCRVEPPPAGASSCQSRPASKVRSIPCSLVPSSSAALRVVRLSLTPQPRLSRSSSACAWRPVEPSIRAENRKTLICMPPQPGRGPAQSPRKIARSSQKSRSRVSMRPCATKSSATPRNTSSSGFDSVPL